MLYIFRKHNAKIDGDKVVIKQYHLYKVFCDEQDEETFEELYKEYNGKIPHLENYEMVSTENISMSNEEFQNCIKSLKEGMDRLLWYKNDKRASHLSDTVFFCYNERAVFISIK